MGNQRNSTYDHQTNTTTHTTEHNRTHEREHVHQPSRLYFARPPQRNPTLVITPTTQATASDNVVSQSTIAQYVRQRKKVTSITFGENLQTKADTTYRIISNNIGCIGLDSHINPKQASLKDCLVQDEIDLAGWQEIGLAQHMLPKHDRLSERMRDYRRKQIRISSSNNKHESIERFQWGGTAFLAYDSLANMTRASGADEAGLGRWSWIQLEGHRNRRVRVISAYNPCRTRTTQFATVYSQQKRYFLCQNMDVCPRAQFRKDLCSLISK